MKISLLTSLAGLLGYFLYRRTTISDNDNSPNEKSQSKLIEHVDTDSEISNTDSEAISTDSEVSERELSDDEDLI